MGAPEHQLEGQRDGSKGTLGDILYADKSRSIVPEADWVALIDGIAKGDQGAFHALYHRMHRIVFTLMLRITKNTETAEELTLDVFHDVWRQVSDYDPANGSVIGWIMNRARSRAIDRQRREERNERLGGVPGA